MQVTTSDVNSSLCGYSSPGEHLGHSADRGPDAIGIPAPPLLRRLGGS